MKADRTFLSACLLALCCCASAAAPTAAPIRAEIDALLARLESSGCRFNRNGSWHDAAEAKAHLLRKLAYVERRGSLQSTEQFIDVAASGSSTSNRPYQVQCGTGAPETSRAWLNRELAAVRSRP